MLATIAGSQFTADLKPQLALLVDDMRTRLADDPGRTATWRDAHQQAVKDKRTAAAWTDYVEDQLTQGAVGWLLTSVFVRFCEDNMLLGPTAVWITSPNPALRQRALDAEEHFYRDERGEEQGNRSYREWLEEAFAALRENPGTASLVDDHAAIGIMEPSSYAVEQLLGYWRRTDDHGDLVWRFDDPDLSTRFLGDLYQDLSDYAKKKYALLQTPEFVEEFILDRTMKPALKDRALEGFKLIDPTCGSGHFLLGAFARLVRRWEDEAPGMDSRARVDKALESVHGVDLNAFAVAIAKFRLIVAAMKASGDESLVNVPKYTLNVATGDSLLHGPERDAFAIDFDDPNVDKDSVASGFAYVTEDLKKLRDLLTLGQYDVVVGNPPYIAVSDTALNARYRERYNYCKGTYALTVPFMERFFTLAKRGDRPGWVGQITSNSFMKREFGVPIVEKFLAKKDLRLVADTSGAYIPGHGTPTAIIVGRNQEGLGEVRAVLGNQGEPGVPEVSSQGKVWSSIAAHVDEPGYEDKWISVLDLARRYLKEHPWSLTGGGALELGDELVAASGVFVGDKTQRIGFFGMTHADPAMIVDSTLPGRHGYGEKWFREIVEGDNIRDFSVKSTKLAFFPYDTNHELIPLSNIDTVWKFLWPNRTDLGNRATFTKGTYFSERRPWYEWHQLPKDSNPLSIAYAFVATHNHFVIDYGSGAFTQGAPLVKLAKGSSEDDYLRILGVLDSSISCFWLRQKCYNNGRPGAESAGADERWEHRFQFGSKKIGGVPLPKSFPLERTRHLNTLARSLMEFEPGFMLQKSVNGLREAIRESSESFHTIRALLVAEQEELDWECYYRYGLIDEDLSAQVGVAPGLLPADRAFAIRLAREEAAAEVETTWFDHHNHKFERVRDLPIDWPQDYKDLVQRRLDVMETNQYIRLLERPEYKRRWAGEPWDAKLRRALRDWLLDKIESPQLWVNQQGMPQPRSVGELAGELGRDPMFIEALDLWAGHRDAPVAETMMNLLADQAVPYLAAWRYKDSGLRKRAEWERVWELQRDEDAWPDRGNQYLSAVKVRKGRLPQRCLLVKSWQA